VARRLAQLQAPAPQGPHGQQPGGPAEPHQHARRALPILALLPGVDQAVAPLPQHPGAERCNRHAQQPPRGPAVAVGQPGLAGRQSDGDGACAQQHGHGGRPPEGHRQQAQQGRHGGEFGLPGHGGSGKEHGAHGTQLHQGVAGLVCQLGQPQAGQQGQQAPIGEGARIVGGRGLTTKREGHRLRPGRARQAEDGLPGAQQGQTQQQHEGQAHHQVRRHAGWQQLQGHSAQPVLQQARGVRAQAIEQGQGPRRLAVCQGLHVAKGRHVHVTPGFAAHKAGQHVGGTQQQHDPAREAANGILGNDGGRGWVHGKRKNGAPGSGAMNRCGHLGAQACHDCCGRAAMVRTKKKGSPVAQAAFWQGK